MFVGSNFNKFFKPKTIFFFEKDVHIRMVVLFDYTLVKKNLIGIGFSKRFYFLGHYIMPKKNSLAFNPTIYLR
ncbi:MAG: hypothetical protein CM15mV69_690 [Caudoviricetes sp.]|nr:MAG: hypothetical protein CM15mV69_690 [Caudoviricetes sp.]